MTRVFRQLCQVAAPDAKSAIYDCILYHIPFINYRVYDVIHFPPSRHMVKISKDDKILTQNKMQSERVDFAAGTPHGGLDKNVAKPEVHSVSHFHQRRTEPLPDK